MSRSYRSYDADWQRRKSLLIRSLFHDIPILSPVTEESNENSNFEPPHDVFEVSSPSSSRSYSPLPPLIIERAPNKHDEPEEYYKKLLTKIKKIYQKLFIENKELSSDDYNLTFDDNLSYDDHLVESNEDLDINADFHLPVFDHGDKEDSDSITAEDRESSVSINSDGYGADFESVETEMIDVLNNTDFNEDEELRYEEEETSNENAEEQVMIKTDNVNESGIEMKDTNETNRVTTEDEDNANKSIEARNHRRLTFGTTEHNDIRIDEQQINVIEKSNEINEREVHVDIINDQEMNESEKSSDGKGNSVRVDSDEDEGTNSSYDDLRSNKSQKSNETISRNQESSKEESIKININNNKSPESNNKAPNDEQKEIEYAVTNENELKLDNRRASICERELNVPHVEPMEEDDEISTSCEGTDYRQITTEALVHVDGTQDVVERESRIYEDSIRSLILPTRQFIRVVEARNDDEDDRIEELSTLEDHDDPETTTTFDTNESETVYEDIEVMRTPQLDNNIQNDSMQIENKDSEIENEHTPIAQELTNLSSVSHDGIDTNISEHKTSNDINEILTSIFNDSPNDGTARNDRKRKIYEDVSIQTSSRVNWDDLRGNFFIGTPKVFRLCSCFDHVCR